MLHTTPPTSETPWAKSREQTNPHPSRRSTPPPHRRVLVAGQPPILHSRFTLVDLAGSEKQKHSQAKGVCVRRGDVLPTRCPRPQPLVEGCDMAESAEVEGVPARGGGSPPPQVPGFPPAARSSLTPDPHAHSARGNALRCPESLYWHHPE